jgi:hypothetical protein
MINNLPADVQLRYNALVSCIEAHTLLEKYKVKVLDLPWNHLLKKEWFDEINHLQLRLEMAFSQKRQDTVTDVEVDEILNTLERQMDPRLYTNPKYWTFTLSSKGKELLSRLLDANRESPGSLKNFEAEKDRIRTEHSSWVYSGPKIE